MNEEVKALVVEHFNLIKMQGQNMKDLARIGHEFNSSINKKTYELEYRNKRKEIDTTRNRIIEIEETLHKMAGCIED